MLVLVKGIAGQVAVGFKGRYERIADKEKAIAAK